MARDNCLYLVTGYTKGQAEILRHDWAKRLVRHRLTKRMGVRIRPAAGVFYIELGRHDGEPLTTADLGRLGRIARGN